VLSPTSRRTDRKAKLQVLKLLLATPNIRSYTHTALPTQIRTHSKNNLDATVKTVLRTYSDSSAQMLGRLKSVKSQLTRVCRRLPSLRAVYLRLYMGRYDLATKLDEFEEWLQSMVCMDKLRQLKIIFCDNPRMSYDLSSRKHVLVDWKSEQLKPPTVITGPASEIEYAESCCDGLSYDTPRVGEVAWCSCGEYLGVIGDDREVFMPIPTELLYSSGLFEEGTRFTPERMLAGRIGIRADEMRAAGLGSYLDGSWARDDKNEVDADALAVSSRASGSDSASQVRTYYSSNNSLNIETKTKCATKPP
jgi:hypothetical protein